MMDEIMCDWTAWQAGWRAALAAHRVFPACAWMNREASALTQMLDMEV